MCIRDRWLTGQKEKCLDLLVKSERLPEAAIFGANYGVSSEKLESTVKSWKNKLDSKNKSKVSARLEDSLSGLKISTNGSAAPLIDLEATEAVAEVEDVAEPETEADAEEAKEVPQAEEEEAAVEEDEVEEDDDEDA